MLAKQASYIPYIIIMNNNIMLLKKSPSLVFKVRRNPPELVAPAGPTPHETKLLSDIDDQKGLCYHIPFMQFFRYHPSMKGKDPVQVIREAVAKTLVFYYPLAGRLRECSPNGKLMVDCNGEGVMFIEAHADVTLEQFGDDLHPPFPCFDELLYIVPGSGGIINCPIVLIQVTRLMCGGLICAMRFNHAMLDGIGMSQFMTALAEMARGEPKPSIMPVWCRELLCARNPPRVTCVHHEYQQLPLFHNKNNYHNLSFFVGPKEIAAMRRLLPHNIGRSVSTFEVITAYLWRCHTAAMQWQNPDQEVRFLCVVNARFDEPCRLNPPIPEGFYGNAVVFPAAVSTMRNLCSRPLGYALELVKKAKYEANEEFVHSVADLMAIKGRPYFTRPGSILVSDFTKFWPRDHVDYGWGKSLFNGPARTNLGEYHDVIFYVPYTNSKGEQGKLVLICLPQEAIERFETELNGMLNNEDKHPKILNSNL